VQAILSRAVDGASERGDDLSHDDLLAIGRELGIAEASIAAAAAGIGDELAVKRAVDERVRRARRAFANHLISFLLVNALLAVINFTVGGPLWFLWSVFGWAIGLTFHARAAFLPDRERLGAQARKRIERDRERDEKRERRRRGASDRGPTRIEAAVQDVVAETLGAVADAISDARPSRARSARGSGRGERAVGVRVERAGARVEPAVAAEHDEDDESQPSDDAREDRRLGRFKRR
jgi:hypothetical protein